jgi:hypothetical protein
MSGIGKVVSTRAGQATRFGGPEVLVPNAAPDSVAGPVANENDEGEDHVICS